MINYPIVEQFIHSDRNVVGKNRRQFFVDTRNDS